MRSKVEIAEFEFFEGSQRLKSLVNNDSYMFIQKTIEDLLTKQEILTDRISFTGTKEDMVCYLSGLIEIFLIEMEEENFTPVQIDIDLKSLEEDLIPVK
jgi:hypothetical protein